MVAKGLLKFSSNPTIAATGVVAGPLEKKKSFRFSCLIKYMTMNEVDYQQMNKDTQN